ncbi:hypothetical protein DIPPA_15615 [Diplonema papillatum]|nr:hypothetical protein DIPPA_15615 [Diplonema papillatum]
MAEKPEKSDPLPWYIWVLVGIWVVTVALVVADHFYPFFPTWPDWVMEPALKVWVNKEGFTAGASHTDGDASFESDEA